MHENATCYENASKFGCIEMHMNAPCTKCNNENAYEGKQMHQLQNATYINA